MSTTPADAYAPDPDRDSAAVVEAFLRRLDDDLADLGLTEPTRAALRRLVDARRAILESSGGEPPDEPARYNRRYTAAVLAAYRTLRAEPGLPTGADLVAWLTAAFTEPFSWVTEVTRAMLDAEPDPFAAMVELARDRETRDFGAEFAFAHPADDADRFHADIHRCGFHDFFARHGAPELTPVLCAFDGNWIAAIDPDRHGFTFSRDTTIGFGGGFCPFHFTRTSPG